MLDDFMLRAAAAGIGLAIAAGPLGCFVLWRRMAYFGDATAHAAVLGVALALALSISIYAGVLVTALAMGLAVWRLNGRGLGMDALLGVAAHGSLAIGLVAVALGGGPRVNLEAFLFGDVLAVTGRDLWVIWGGAAAVLGLVMSQWRALLLATLSPDMAVAEGRDPAVTDLVLTVALAVLVAVAIKVVGALLVTALLIIPAAAARPLVRSPEAMAGLAVVIGVAAVLVGLSGAYVADAPAGPSIVSAATGFFLGSLAVARLGRGRAVARD